MSEASVRVFVYGDYVCPFSYVADARLRRLRGEVDLRMLWRPLPIHGTVPPAGLRRAELGVPPDEAAELRRAVESMARELELPLEWPDRVVNSYEALQVAEFAKDIDEESFERVHRKLFRAYFAEGRNLGRREELVEVAVAAGLDEEAVARCLEDARYEDELRRAEREAERYGIESTPTMLFERFKVVGAAPLDVMRKAARRAARGLAATTDLPDSGDEGVADGETASESGTAPGGED